MASYIKTRDYGSSQAWVIQFRVKGNPRPIYLYLPKDSHTLDQAKQRRDALCKAHGKPIPVDEGEEVLNPGGPPHPRVPQARGGRVRRGG